MKLTTADQREMVLRSIVTAAVAGMLIIVLGSGTSVAAGGRQDFTFELPAGSACDGFAVSVAVSGGNQIVREFRDTTFWDTILKWASPPTVPPLRALKGNLPLWRNVRFGSKADIS